MIDFECPRCSSKSFNFSPYGVSTLMYSASFTDEDGKYHHHDPNSHTKGARCRKCGLSLEVKEYSKCWCGWQGGTTKLFWDEDQPDLREDKE